ncbi:hypothetical protein [Aliivibrio wodanis]|uniref:hypothetical protein n=1 Tax=Aliivibrio wodanis TaxID=80852 RepID=UPI00406CA595
MSSEQDSTLTINDIDNELHSITPEQMEGALGQFEAIMERLITGCDETSEQGLQEKERLQRFEKDILNSHFNPKHLSTLR